jgi:3-oxoacyl-[acyl-carrier-protein] synthase II
VTGLGFGLEETADAISDLAIFEATDGNVRARTGRCMVRDFDLAQFVPTQRPYLDAQSRWALAAGALAFDNAAVQFDEVRPGRCGCAYGTMLGNVETLERFQALVDDKGLRLASPVLFAHSYPNSTSSLLAIEFALAGFSQNFCGNALCGAQAMEAAFLALGGGRADLMVAGGGDVIPAVPLGRLAGPGGLLLDQASQGVGLLVLETQDALERREGYAFCELGSVVCGAVHGPGTPDGVAEALGEAVRRALAEASVWEGDIGAVLLCPATGGAGREAEDRALESFSQVPRTSMQRYAGDTLAAAFPLECILAADMLGNGFAPPKVSFARESRGVEFWVERRPEPMLGQAALVVGCTDALVAAAVLVAL